jgi:hypothetical protein
MLKYVFYYSATEVLRDLPSNAGIEKAVLRSEEMRRQGFLVELVDTNLMGPGELQGRYIESIGPSVVKKYRVRQVFGSRRRAGWLFGRGVPGLVVMHPSGTVEDLFPHERAGKLVTIADFVDSLLEERAQVDAVTLRSARKRR